MKALVLYEKKDGATELRYVPRPEVGPGDVLIFGVMAQCPTPGGKRKIQYKAMISKVFPLTSGRRRSTGWRRKR